MYIGRYSQDLVMIFWLLLRFIRKKEDLEKLQKSQTYTSRASSAVSQEQQVNNDFDVDEYEPEEYSYQRVSLTRTFSVVVKPEKPFYIPLTDVTYPGEKDSTYDLKKLVQEIVVVVIHICLINYLFLKRTNFMKMLNLTIYIFSDICAETIVSKVIW